MDESQRTLMIRRTKRRLAVLGVLVGFIIAVLATIYFAAPQWLLRAAEMYQAQRAGLQTKSVQAGYTRWVYYEGGKGDAPTLVLLHGYMGNRQAWLSMAPYLTPNFHVIIPDLPGWGASSRIADADYGYPAQAKRLHEFFQTLHLGGIALAGHSMGGAIAGLYASEHPQDVGALILIDSAGAPFKDNAFSRELKAGRNPFDLQNRADFERLEKSLWGSLDARDRVTLDLALALAPTAALRYVLVHELCHLKVRSHSKRFWSWVENLYPDYQAQRDWLREHGAVLKAEMERLTAPED